MRCILLVADAGSAVVRAWVMVTLHLLLLQLLLMLLLLLTLMLLRLLADWFRHHSSSQASGS